MTKAEISEIAVKYRNFASSMSARNEEKADYYERFADYLEENDYFDDYDDDFYETERDLLDSFNEMEGETEYQWNNMFPEGDEDDSITDFMTKEW